MTQLGHTPASLDLLINQGEDFDSTLTYKDENGSVVNLTGYTARGYIKLAATTPNPPVAKFATSGSTTGVATLGGTAGTIRLQMTAAVTDAIVAGTYVWDFELVSGAGVVIRLWSGNVTVSQSITTGT